MKLLKEKDPVEVFTKAVEILYNATAHSLGPNGANTAVVYGERLEANPKFNIINDGKQIIDNLTSEEVEVACAMQTIKESVLSTNSKAGDGTTSTILLLHELMKSFNKSNCSAEDRVRAAFEFKKAKKRLLDELKKYKLTLGDVSSIKEIAEVSLGSCDFSDLFEEAFEFAGVDGTVLLEKTNDEECSVSKIDGLSLNMIGFVPELALDANGEINKEEVDCKAVVLNGTIKTFTAISDVLLKSKGSKELIVMFYSSMTQEVFNMFMTNAMKPEYNILPVSLEGYKDQMFKYTHLISAAIGSKVLDVSTKIDWKNVEFGSIPYLLCNSEALVLRPVGDVSSTLKDYKLNLSPRTAIVKVAAGNGVLLEERFRRFEDAVHSCANSLKTGIVLGAGRTYVSVANDIVGLPDTEVSLRARDCIHTAFRGIYSKLFENCGLEAPETAKSIPGYDEETGAYIIGVVGSSDKVRKEVYDSYSVAEQVITNVLDMFVSILSVKALICDVQR